MLDAPTLELARKSGLTVLGDPLQVVGNGDQLAAFAAAVRKEERERCAALAIEWADGRHDERGGNALRNFAAAVLSQPEPGAPT